ncbi:MAG: hypothetical protein C4539_14530 [Ignavibacteriales bacterium]|nr:MAG: hypothetical protein C4539_14530 [Ignavibacteriales bacterium]
MINEMKRILNVLSVSIIALLCFNGMQYAQGWTPQKGNYNIYDKYSIHSDGTSAAPDIFIVNTSELVAATDYEYGTDSTSVSTEIDSVDLSAISYYYKATVTVYVGAIKVSFTSKNMENPKLVQANMWKQFWKDASKSKIYIQNDASGTSYYELYVEGN